MIWQSYEHWVVEITWDYHFTQVYLNCSRVDLTLLFVPHRVGSDSEGVVEDFLIGCCWSSGFLFEISRTIYAVAILWHIWRVMKGIPRRVRRCTKYCGIGGV